MFFSEWNLIERRRKRCLHSVWMGDTSKRTVGHRTRHEFCAGIRLKQRLTIRIYTESLYTFLFVPLAQANQFSEKSDKKRTKRTFQRTRRGYGQRLDEQKNETKIRSLQCFWFLSQIGWHWKQWARHHSKWFLRHNKYGCEPYTPKLFKVWNSLGDLDK